MKKLFPILLFSLFNYYPNPVFSNLLIHIARPEINASDPVFSFQYNSDTQIFPILTLSGYANHKYGIHNYRTNFKPIVFTNPRSNVKIKRHNIFTIGWSGGDSAATYSLELYKGSILAEEIAIVENTGTYKWFMPRNTKGSKNYRFKITNTKFNGDYAYSGSFIIKHKVPQIIWIVPVAAIVGGIYYLIINYPDKPPADLPGPMLPF